MCARCLPNPGANKVAPHCANSRGRGSHHCQLKVNIMNVKYRLDPMQGAAEILTLLAAERYSVGAAAKSVAGIRTPKLIEEPTHALAWFFVGTRPPFTWVLLAYPAIGILSVMVARVGQPSGWPVFSSVAGSTNPIRATAMRFVPQVGSDNLLTEEAAIMATVPNPLAPVIQVINGQAVTTSLDLARCFDKHHKNVIAKIEKLDCSSEFTALNFKRSTYTDPTGRELPCYQLTRDGFAFVAMSFTGSRAAQFKEAYIAEFNRMERQLNETFPQFIDRIDHELLADTIEHLITFFKTIRAPWESHLYPMLVAAQSPWAAHLYARFPEMTTHLEVMARELACVRGVNHGR